ncbi:hypothetical protein B7992_04025 [Fibrobacter sp. UWH1]|nr:hypothetical protein B7992_04025 [Fibrobacter sp. UWH1]
MVLDSSDGREKVRERLFYKNWYIRFGQEICDMEALPGMVVDSINIITYLMFPKDFVNKDFVMQVMSNYIKESFC